MTQLEKARKGIITDEIRFVAEVEGISPEELREKVAQGLVVFPQSKSQNL
jgi:hydroxymethylpyrimidine synthase